MHVDWSQRDVGVTWSGVFIARCSLLLFLVGFVAVVSLIVLSHRIPLKADV